MRVNLGFEKLLDLAIVASKPSAPSQVTPPKETITQPSPPLAAQSQVTAPKEPIAQPSPPPAAPSQVTAPEETIAQPSQPPAAPLQAGPASNRSEGSDITPPLHYKPASGSKPSASITETNYQTQLTDPGERRKRFRELPSLTTEFSSSVWDDALRVLVRDSPFLVDAIKDARSVTEYELGQRFRELMETASNTPRFVKGVQRFSKQIPELLDRVFEKLVTVVDEQRAFTNEDL